MDRVKRAASQPALSGVLAPPLSAACSHFSTLAAIRSHTVAACTDVLPALMWQRCIKTASLMALSVKEVGEYNVDLTQRLGASCRGNAAM